MMMNRSEDEYLHLAHTHCWSSMSQMLCSSKNMNSGISADIRFLIRHHSTSLLFIHLRYIHPQPTWPHHKTIRSQFHSLVWGPQGKIFFSQPCRPTPVTTEMSMKTKNFSHRSHSLSATILQPQTHKPLCALVNMQILTSRSYFHLLLWGWKGKGRNHR